MRIRNKEKGFTLIELLIVVAIIGIIAAIAIPNLLNAIDRGKQKRTMSDMRSIGTAVESYAVDINFYPRGFALASISGGVESDIEPVYIRTAPLLDGWNNSTQYESDATGSQYTVLSNAKDGVVSALTGGPTGDFDCDIIFTNGGFFQWPEGQQT